MTRIQRDAAVRVFLSRDKAPIMLMSQKCGGVGEWSNEAPFDLRYVSYSEPKDLTLYVPTMSYPLILGGQRPWRRRLSIGVDDPSYLHFHV